jgi:hypothetical protein
LLNAEVTSLSGTDTLYETAKVWRALVPATTPEGTGGGPGCGDGALDKGRLEAFSDGVIAIIITIMVLELKAPHGADLGALIALASAFLSYVLSLTLAISGWVASGVGEAFENGARDICDIGIGPGR